MPLPKRPLQQKKLTTVLAMKSWYIAIYGSTFTVSPQWSQCSWPLHWQSSCKIHVRFLPPFALWWPKNASRGSWQKRSESRNCTPAFCSKNLATSVKDFTVVCACGVKGRVSVIALAQFKCTRSSNFQSLQCFMTKEHLALLSLSVVPLSFLHTGSPLLEVSKEINFQPLQKLMWNFNV